MLYKGKEVVEQTGSLTFLCLFAGLAEPQENVRVGQAASVYIKALIPEKMKVKLIIVDVFDSPAFPSKINYFINSGRIKSWVYSTPEAQKHIVTEFA